MLLGLFFAIGACFVWGFIFVIPQFLDDFSAIEVVLGRYLVYGLISAGLALRSGLGFFKRFPVRIWALAFAFALFSNIIYYLGLVAGLRYASPTIAVLIVGMAPILIAFYGNWHAKEIACRDLATPSCLIVLGLVLVNLTEINWGFETESIGLFILGWFGIFVSLIAWCWYAVRNARFLKQHPHISPHDWSTVIGVATLFWAVVVGGVLASVSEDMVYLPKFLIPSFNTLRFLMGALFMGLICSWLGCFLWGLASVYLPISLMGSFLIFETLFGLLFVYLFQNQMPSWLELFGIVLMLGGIIMCVDRFRKNRQASKIS